MFRTRKLAVSLVGAALALAALPLLAASRFSPDSPVPFERVDLRLTVDNCIFDPDSVSIERKGDTLRVFQHPRQCLLPGTPIVVDIQLGAFTAGTYPVELYADSNADAPPAEKLTLTVHPLFEIAVYPRAAHPLTDYSGWWWSPSEPGWGLTLMQGGTYGLFGAWHVFDAQGAPRWFTLQAGSWSSSTVWSGKLVSSTGAWLELPNYDPTAFHNNVVGDVTLDFSQTPGHEGQATLRYTLDGITGSKTIQRMRL